MHICWKPTARPRVITACASSETLKVRHVRISVIGLGVMRSKKENYGDADPTGTNASLTDSRGVELPVAPLILSNTATGVGQVGSAM